MRRPERVAASRALGVSVLVLMSGAPTLLFPDSLSAQCEPPGGFVGTRNFHYDHLGSVQLITTHRGDTYWGKLRYDAFGKVRKRTSVGGDYIGDGEYFNREFTGHHKDYSSGLQNAGARFYDPELGQFLTHDPADEFPSPYAYGPGDPVNGSDPTGAFWINTALIVAGVLLLQAALMAYAQGGITAAARTLAFGALGVVAGFGIGLAGHALALYTIGEGAATVLSGALQMTSVGMQVVGASPIGRTEGFQIASYVVAGLSLALSFGRVVPDGGNAGALEEVSSASTDLKNELNERRLVDYNDPDLEFDLPLADRSGRNHFELSQKFSKFVSAQDKLLQATGEFIAKFRAAEGGGLVFDNPRWFKGWRLRFGGTLQLKAAESFIHSHPIDYLDITHGALTASVPDKATVGNRLGIVVRSGQAVFFTGAAGGGASNPVSLH